MDEITIKAFIKFGKKKDMMDLFENGTIYCNTFEYFRKLEDNLLRGDSYEGTYRITKFPSDYKLSITFSDGQTFEVTPQSAHRREFYTNINGNLYSMSAVTAQEMMKIKHLEINPENARFGDHFVVI